MAPSISHQARAGQLCGFVPCGCSPVHINWNWIHIWTKIWGQHLVNLYFFFQFMSTWVHPRFLMGSVVLVCLVAVLYWYVLMFCFVCLRPVLCAPKCCQCLWIVNSWLPLRVSLTFIHLSCRENKRSRKQKGKSRMDNIETLNGNTGYTRHRRKTVTFR